MLTEFSIQTVTELKQQLPVIRQQGFALENQESALGVVCLGIAVPSRGINGPKLGVSVSSVTVTFDDKRKNSLLSELDTLAALLGNPLHTRIDIQQDN